MPPNQKTDTIRLHDNACLDATQLLLLQKQIASTTNVQQNKQAESDAYWDWTKPARVKTTRMYQAEPAALKTAPVDLFSIEHIEENLFKNYKSSNNNNAPTLVVQNDDYWSW